MRREDWEQFEQRADGGSEPAETILDEISASSPEWDVLSGTISGDAEDGRVLFVLVIRRRVNDDGHLILSERYVKIDLDADEDDRVTWLSNGIERRMQGSLGAGLRVLYAATTNGATDPSDPMQIDSREDGLSYQPEELTDPIAVDGGSDEPEVERT